MNDHDSAKVAENDLRKLHAEVNQIVSQRFSLTTLAIILFATICSFTTSFIGRADISPEFICSVSTLLLIVLLMIFIYFMLLLGMMRVLTVYIHKKYQSPWEAEWKQYRNIESSKSYWGYTISGTVIFHILGFLSLIFPVLLLLIYGKITNKFPMALFIPISTFLVYEVIILLAAKFRNKLINEAKIAGHWDIAIERSSVIGLVGEPIPKTASERPHK